MKYTTQIVASVDDVPEGYISVSDAFTFLYKNFGERVAVSARGKLYVLARKGKIPAVKVAATVAAAKSTGAVYVRPTEVISEAEAAAERFAAEEARAAGALPAASIPAAEYAIDDDTGRVSIPEPVHAVADQPQPVAATPPAADSVSMEQVVAAFQALMDRLDRLEDQLANLAVNQDRPRVSVDISPDDLAAALELIAEREPAPMLARSAAAPALVYNGEAH